jgi:epoxyqueuosine reductase
MNNKAKNTTIVKRIARELGFDFVGVSKAEKLVDEEKHLSSWLKNHHHGQMDYMANHFEKRIDPTKLVEGSKSVVTLMYNYNTNLAQKDPSAPKISSYAYGTDYHFIIKDKLKEFLYRLQEEIGQVEGRVFVDSAPVLERAWAQKSGLGWIGKNSLLINKTRGSFYFLAELISDLDLDPDGPIKDYCGTCTKCIDACPTEAIIDNRVVDGSKCISYLTIELKEEIIPKEFEDKMDNWMFGCDVCQDVCPWNRFGVENKEPLFQPSEKLLEMSAEDWIEMDEKMFQVIFKKSPVKRTKFNGLKRNIQFLKPSQKHP